MTFNELTAESVETFFYLQLFILIFLVLFGIGSLIFAILAKKMLVLPFILLVGAIVLCLNIMDFKHFTSFITMFKYFGQFLLFGGILLLLSLPVALASKTIKK